MSVSGLNDVFLFWLDNLLKLFDLMKQIPIYENISLYNCFIAMCIISIFVGVLKIMMKTHYLIRWSDNTATYYNTENEYGLKNFGKPRR